MGQEVVYTETPCSLHLTSQLSSKCMYPHTACLHWKQRLSGTAQFLDIQGQHKSHNNICDLILSSCRPENTHWHYISHTLLPTHPVRTLAAFSHCDCHTDMVCVLCYSKVKRVKEISFKRHNFYPGTLPKKQLWILKKWVIKVFPLLVFHNSFTSKRTN